MGGAWGCPLLYQLVPFVGGKFMAYRWNAKEFGIFVSFFFTTWLTCIFEATKLGFSGVKLTGRWLGTVDARTRL
jgi:hypothetical protein